MNTNQNETSFNDISTRDLNKIGSLLNEVSSFEELIMKLDIHGLSSDIKIDIFNATKHAMSKEIQTTIKNRKSSFGLSYNYANAGEYLTIGSPANAFSNIALSKTNSSNTSSI